MSDPGLKREKNEDRYHADEERGIYVVVDGIGGQAAGDVAADTALKFIVERLERRTGTAERRIREAITLANNEIYRLSESNETLKGMECVLTAALVEDSQLTVGHVGDTRLYEISNGSIQQLTRDHSPVGAMEADGTLRSDEEAMRHPRRNEVYRGVGHEEHDPDDEGFIDLIQRRMEPDSSILLCSDGLSDMVSRDGILKIVQKNADDPEAVVGELIKAANAAGGNDNVTVVYVQGAGSTQTQLSGGDSRTKGTLKLIRGSVSAVPRLLKSRWMFFIYGAALTLIIVALTQRYFRWWVAPQGDTESRGEQRRSLIVAQSGEASYPDIASALAAARAGDTVQISPGEYHEQIQIKEGVTLVSIRPREAVIKLTRGGGGQAAVIATDVKAARIVGLKIVGDDSTPLAAGIRIIGSSVIVEDVELTGARGPGIEIVGDGVSTLRANYIHDNFGAGVVIRGPDARPRLAHNVIVGNGKSGDKTAPGIQLDDQARPTLLWNYVTANGGGNITGLPEETKEAVSRNNIFSQDVKESSTQKSGNRPRRR